MRHLLEKFKYYYIELCLVFSVVCVISAFSTFAAITPTLHVSLSSHGLPDVIVRGQETEIGSLALTAESGSIDVNRMIFSPYGDMKSGNIHQIWLKEPGGITLGPENAEGNVAVFIEDFMVPSGTTRTFKIFAEITPSTPEGDEFGLYFASNGNIEAEEDFGGNAEVSINFPAQTQLVSAIDSQTDTIASFSLQNTENTIAQIFRGQEKAVLGEFQFSTHGIDGISFQKIILERFGSTPENVIQNLHFADSSGSIISTPSFYKEGKVYFSDVLTLEQGEEKIFFLRGDVSSFAVNGETVGFQIFSRAGVTAVPDDGDTTLVLRDTFPLRTPLFTLSDPFVRFELNSETPQGRIITGGESGVPLALFTLHAGTEPVTLSRITLHKRGSLNPSTLSRLKITDINGKTLMDSLELSLEDAITFTGILKLEPFEEISLLLKASFDYGLPVGKSIGYEMQSARDIRITTVKDEYNVDIQGEFPLQGNIMTTSNQESKGVFEVSFVPHEPQNRIFSANSQNVPLSKLFLQARESDIELSQIILSYNGSFLSDEITNLHFRDNLGHILSARKEITDNLLVFDFLLPVRENSSKEIFLYGDLGNASSGRTLSFQITSPKNVTIKNIQPHVTASVVGNFPMQSLQVTPQQSSFESGVFFSSRGVPPENVTRGSSDVFLGQLAMRNTEPKEVMIEKLIMQQIGEVYRGIERISLRGELGELLAQENGVFENEIIIFDDFEETIRIQPGEEKVVTFLADISRDVDLGKSLQLSIVSPGYIDAKRFGGGDANIMGNFPLSLPAATVIFYKTNLYCDTVSAPVCGKIYETCSEFPCLTKEITYINECKLREDLAYFQYDGECIEKLPDIPSARFEDIVMESFEGFQIPFPDINITSEEGKSALELFRRGVINGFPDGDFKGEESVNRVQSAKFLLLTKYAEEDISDEKSGFRYLDTDHDAWYIRYVNMATNMGIINGYPDKTFRPANTVNTVEFLKMLTLTFDLQTNLPFRYFDVNGNDWFAPYVGIAQKYELFPDRGSYLFPAHELSRYEVARALYQFLKNR